MKIRFEKSNLCRLCGITFHKDSFHQKNKTDEHLLITGEDANCEKLKIMYFSNDYEDDLTSNDLINSEQENQSRIKMKCFFCDGLALRNFSKKH